LKDVLGIFDGYPGYSCWASWIYLIGILGILMGVLEIFDGCLRDI